MNTAKLSTSERSGVEQAAKSGSRLVKHEEFCHGAVTYSASAGKSTLFLAMLPDAFQVLWNQAEVIYAEASGQLAKLYAVKMLSVMSQTDGYGSKKIAQLASIEYDPVLLDILKKLLKAGKVRFDAGRWFLC